MEREFDLISQKNTPYPKKFGYAINGKKGRFYRWKSKKSFLVWRIDWSLCSMIEFQKIRNLFVQKWQYRFEILEIKKDYIRACLSGPKIK